MASFFSGMGAAIRRAVGTEKAEPISLETSAGPLRFSAEEAKLYSLVFAAMDSDDDGEIGGGEGATFLRRTGLSEAQLKTVSGLPVYTCTAAAHSREMTRHSLENSAMV